MPRCHFPVDSSCNCNACGTQPAAKLRPRMLDEPGPSCPQAQAVQVRHLPSSVESVGERYHGAVFLNDQLARKLRSSERRTMDRLGGAPGNVAVDEVEVDA